MCNFHAERVDVSECGGYTLGVSRGDRGKSGRMCAVLGEGANA